MSELRVEVLPTAAEVARRAAAYVAERARACLAASGDGRFTFAVSGGRTPWAMFEQLKAESVPWARVAIYQVDERLAPPDDPDRSLARLLQSLPRAAAARVHPMPVDETDLEAAAARYAAELPNRFDLIHLGLGADGHTASLFPGDPVLDFADRDVALTGEYRGRRRMTLTYPVLDRAFEVVWLVVGADKVEPLRLLLARDRSIPGGRVSAERQVVFADRAAAASD